MARLVKGSFYGAVTLGQRGQVVLPAKVRRDFGLYPGDKVLVYGRMDHGRIEIYTADLVARLMDQTMAEISDLSHMLKEIKERKGQLARGRKKRGRKED